MDAQEFAKVLMSESRKQRQDPQAILSQLQLLPSMYIADLACGPGFFTVVMSNMLGEHGRVYAVDQNPVMIEQLKKNLQLQAPKSERNVKVLQEDISKDTGIPSHSVDLVFFANVLHDIDDRKSFFEETKRIARDNNSLFVDVDWHKVEMENGPPLEIRLSEGDSRRIMKENGLEVVYALNAGPYHYGLVARSRRGS